MQIAERFQRIVDGMPEDALVTLPVTTLREWIGETGVARFSPDHTVKQVAEMFDKSPKTVNEWIRTGRLTAYKPTGREYRITEASLEEFRENGMNHRN